MLKPGDRVILRGGERPEDGLVVQTWTDEHGDQDCYVAFFGHDGFPTGKPENIPYVLRYMAASLESAT